MAALLALGTAACGSDDDSGGDSSSTTSATTAAAVNSEISAAQELVDSNVEPVSSFEAPGPAIEGDKSWAGKTVWYIPITTLPPWFQIQAKVQEQVWSMLGAKVKVCDGKVNPTSISTCLRQAVSSDAAAVITDAIPVPFAQEAYTSVVDAKIPIVAGYTDKAAAPTDGNFADHFHPISGEETPTQELGAAQLIVESEGKANVVLAGSNDTPSAEAASNAALEYLKGNCPDCTVKSFLTKNVGNSNLASEVSGQILKNPDADYFYTPYEAPSGQIFLQAIRQTGRKMKFMSTAGDVAGLQRIKDGTQIGDVGLDPVYQGWNYVDAALRAISDMPAVEYKGLLHLFTADNVPDDPTIEGWLSGEWYSDLSFQDLYKETWGVS